MRGQLFPVPISEVHMGKAAHMQNVSLLVNNLLSFAWVLSKQYQSFFWGGGPKKREQNSGYQSNSDGDFSICFTETCQASFW